MDIVSVLDELYLVCSWMAFRCSDWVSYQILREGEDSHLAAIGNEGVQVSAVYNHVSIVQLMRISRISSNRWSASGLNRALGPSERPTFDTLLRTLRGTVFPESFYSFLHNHASSVNELSSDVLAVNSPPPTLPAHIGDETWGFVSSYLLYVRTCKTILEFNLKLTHREYFFYIFRPTVIKIWLERVDTSHAQIARYRIPIDIIMIISNL